MRALSSNIGKLFAVRGAPLRDTVGVVRCRGISPLDMHERFGVWMTSHRDWNDFAEIFHEVCEAFATYRGSRWSLTVLAAGDNSVDSLVASTLASHRAEDKLLLLHQGDVVDSVWDELGALQVRRGVFVEAGTMSGAQVLSQACQMFSGTAGRKRVRAGGSRPRRVFLTEDNLPMARMISLLLARENLEVVHAPTGEQALDMLSSLQSEGFLVCLLDRHLPGLDGLEILEHLRHLPAWQSVPVWMCSAADGAEFLDLAVGRTPDGFLRKPFRPPELLQTIQAAATLGRERGPNAPFLIPLDP